MRAIIKKCSELTPEHVEELTKALEDPVEVDLSYYGAKLRCEATLNNIYSCDRCFHLLASHTVDGCTFCNCRRIKQ